MCALNLLFTFSSFLKSSSNSCTFTLEFLFAILPTWSCSEVSKATNLFAFIFSKKLDFENRLDNEVVQFCERSQTCNAASQVWMKIVLRVISHEKNMICGSWLVVRFSSHVKNTTRDISLAFWYLHQFVNENLLHSFLVSKSQYLYSSYICCVNCIASWGFPPLKKQNNMLTRKRND